MFSGQDKERHTTTRTIEKIFLNVCTVVRIVKSVSVHDLGHSFITHLRYSQEILGDKSSSITEVCAHVSNKNNSKVKRPLDGLNMNEKIRRQKCIRKFQKK